jgi:predicted anti-sigma-YlaC factor YlaD
MQRQVVMLRDVEGLPAPDVCRLLQISDANQRVLLHRARLEAHLAACRHCTEYLAQMRRTLDALGRIEPETLAPEVRDELLALYRRWPS